MADRLFEGVAGVSFSDVGMYEALRRLSLSISPAVSLKDCYGAIYDGTANPPVMRFLCRDGKEIVRRG